MEDGIVLGCWNGKAFVSWEKWLASQPLEAFREAPREVAPSESTPAQPRDAGPHGVATPSLFD